MALKFNPLKKRKIESFPQNAYIVKLRACWGVQCTRWLNLLNNQPQPFMLLIGYFFVFNLIYKTSLSNIMRFKKNKDDNIHKSEALKWYDKRTLTLV